MCSCEGHDPQGAAWTGRWPGEAEAEERGWFVVWTKLGWIRCNPDTKTARPDLNRWAAWNQTGKDHPTNNFEEARDRCAESVAKYLQRAFKPSKQIDIGHGCLLDTRDQDILGTMVDIDRFFSRAQQSVMTYDERAMVVQKMIDKKVGIWSADATIEWVIEDSSRAPNLDW